MSLDELRKEVGEIDDAIIDLIRQRQQVAIRIAHAKYEANLPVHDEVQKKQVIERVLDSAVEHRIDPVSTRRIFECLIDMSEERQRECMGEGNLP